MVLGLTRPIVARVLPFMLFIGLLAVRGELESSDVNFNGLDSRWAYAISMMLVISSLAYFWRDYQEFTTKAALSARQWVLSLLVGIAVFVIWIQLDYPWMQTQYVMSWLGLSSLGGASASFVPLDTAGGLIWPLIIIRIIGATLMVPVMEELFWRSFIMRWIDQPNFLDISPLQITLRAVIFSAILFMLAHTLWLAAIVAGIAYGLLYKKLGSLWSPIIAHATTNGLLGIWVVLTGNWQFW